MADAAEEEGIELTPLADDSQKEVLSWVPFAAPRNPVDVTAQALNDPSILDKGFDLLLGKEKFPALIGFFTTWASSPQMAERLLEPPLPVPPVPQNLPSLPKGAIAEHEAKRILAAAGVPVLPEMVATSAAEAASAAAKIGDRLVLKIVSPQITHKTEVGGVMLDVPASEAGDAYTRLVERVRPRAPGATIEGVLISPMVRGGVEMILGVQNDPVFGPVVMLGLGGIFVEVLRDVTFRIAPFGEEEARRMI